ncbi:MAG: HAD-IC family P-type ATPase, partial [Clostridia bacterium]|nr:HAD-IC family P-type ATPase [Clostridia bacterium]
FGGEIEKDRVSDVKEIAGKGIEAYVDGKRYYLGNAALMREAMVSFEETKHIGTAVYVSAEALFLGAIIINDEIKEDSRKAIKEMKRVGINKTVMLTGDTESVAKAVAKDVGIAEVRAKLLPQDKVAEVEKLIEKGAKVAFVGDGINDAPVLARADVGIAMGALGSDAAIESADIVLMDDKLSKIPLAVNIARKTMRIVRQNIVFALAVKGAILLLGAFGIANMWTAVFGDVGVMVIAILNAMRAMVRINR